jgi:hypothetical protein
VCVLPYSSGTSGIPKGVMLTHRNLVANLCQSARCRRKMLSSDDRVIGVLPFFHIYGMVVIMGLALVEGATIVSMPRFELETFLKVLQDQQVTYANIVPPILLALAKHPVVANYDLSACARCSVARRHWSRTRHGRREAAWQQGAPGLWPHRNESGHALPSARGSAGHSVERWSGSAQHVCRSLIRSRSRTCRPASAVNSGFTVRR